MLNFDKTGTKKEGQVDMVHDRFFTIQVPNLYFETNDISGRVARLTSFAYNPALTEEENYVNLDVDHLACFFKQDDNEKYAFLDSLRAMKFHIGLGSLNMADSILFRTLNIDFIKITPEDIDGYTMFFKLGMPVHLSSYPNSESYFAFEYDNFPRTDS
jgi:hypothetical protein